MSGLTATSAMRLRPANLPPSPTASKSSERTPSDANKNVTMFRAVDASPGSKDSLAVFNGVDLRLVALTSMLKKASMFRVGKVQRSLDHSRGVDH